MIDFTLDDVQEMLTDTVGRYARERLREVFRDADESGTLPADVVQAGWEIGLLPTALPEEFGGFGEHAVVTGALATEEMAWGDLAATLQVGVPALVALPILLAGTAAQKETHLPAFGAETAPAVTAALTEPRLQFDPLKLQTDALRDGDTYLLNGVKGLVPLAADADLFLVYAAEAGQTEAFLIPAGTSGLDIGEREKLMGIRGLPTYRLTLEDCRIPAGNKLGGEAGIDFQLILNHSRVAMAAAAVGVARAGLEYARDYAKVREQFGEPIAYRQSIAFMLAEMAMDVDSARMLVWETAWELDQGRDATAAAAVMKHFIDDMVVRVADQAVQVLGGYGYIREYPVELWLRNARGFATFDGLAIV